jgi:hypothetical protein
MGVISRSLASTPLPPFSGNDLADDLEGRCQKQRLDVTGDVGSRLAVLYEL